MNVAEVISLSNAISFALFGIRMGKSETFYTLNPCTVLMRFEGQLISRFVICSRYTLLQKNSSGADIDRNNISFPSTLKLASPPARSDEKLNRQTSVNMFG